MFDAITDVPPPVNEPVRSFAPGSGERTALEQRLKRFSGLLDESLDGAANVTVSLRNNGPAEVTVTCLGASPPVQPQAIPLGQTFTATGNLTAFSWTYGSPGPTSVIWTVSKP